MYHIPIRFAGIGLCWTPQYSDKYSKKMFDHGYYAKKIQRTNGDWLVAYCHRPFRMEEAESAAESLFGEEW